MHKTNKNIDTDHKCYYNWKFSAPEMEAQIIKEGFQYLDENYNVRINKYIADADTLTFKMLKQTLNWGDKIEKIDCSNHLMKNFTTHVLNWKKICKLDNKFFNNDWANHFTSIVHKLVKEKADVPEYFIKHIKNTLNHLTGDH